MTNLMGWKVKDQLTGYTGTVDAYVERIGGTKQVCVQPSVKSDGTFSEAWFMDEHRLAKVGKNPAVEPIKPVAQTVFPGDEAIDNVSGFKGIVTDCYVYLNGCRKVHMTSRVNSKNTGSETLSLDQSLIRVTKSAKKTETKPKTTGGPPVRAPR